MGAEEWAPVRDWPYEVSNLGRVRRTGAAKGATVGSVVTHGVNWAGYHRVRLHDVDRTWRPLVHHLVYEAFVGPIPEGLDIHHEDGDKSNNAATNLRAVTRSENIRHAYETGLREANPALGEDHGNAVLTERDVRSMRASYESGEATTYDLAEEYGVSQAQAWRIVTRRSWAHVEEEVPS